MRCFFDFPRLKVIVLRSLMPIRFTLTLLIAIFTSAARGWSADVPAEQVEFFEKKIRPVLAAECYECHGGKKQKGDLALDSREGLRKGGESGPVVVPGKPEESLLIRSITHADPDLKMPSKAPKLDERVIADFVAWVKMGAPDPRTEPDKVVAASAQSWPEKLAARRQWWCFQPLDQSAPPSPKNGAWSNHPIDKLLLAKLEERGLTPAVDADPRTLIRRLSFALIGLPPTLDQVEAFVRDYHPPVTDHPSPVAAAADSFLASPAFGERWARHWMDLARYAETFGSEHDYLNPHAWRYRDYLVRAFNTDLHYDRFVQEQIAGDLLDPRWNRELGINEALLGTAWNRMIESYASPVDVKREEASIIDWQIESLGKTFLGLTIQCARCHDHKFDPVSAADFYALYGVFASTRPTMSILDEPAKLTKFDAELARLKDELRPALAARWRRDLDPAALNTVLQRDKNDVLLPLREMAKSQDFHGTWRALRDRYIQRPAGKPEHHLFANLTTDLAGWRVSGPGLPARPTAAGLLSLGSGDKMVHAILPAGYFSDAISQRHGGSIRSPEFVIEKRAVSVLASGAGKARLRLVIENFQNDSLLFEAVNPNLDFGAPRWITMPIKPQWMGRRAHVELLTRDDKPCVGEIKDQDEWEKKTDGRSAFGIQRVVLHDGDGPAAIAPFPPVLWVAEPVNWGEFTAQLSVTALAALDAWVAGRADDEDIRLLQTLLEGGVLANKSADDPNAAALFARFRELEAKIPMATRAPGVCDDGYSTDSAIFPRGDHMQPGVPVARRFPEVLGGAPLGGSESGRLALARELTRPGNPLTARVMANRVWQHLTGRGLVGTPDNFGRMGEKPVNPELLDHLAAKFMADEWSVKSLIRYIVTSRAWQLAAEPPPHADELDPNNDLLSHARVNRLEAEAIRDAMLAVAGNLSQGYTGPGVRVFYRTLLDPVRQPDPGPIDGGGKRSIYLEMRRLFLSEFLAAFDAPKPNIFTGHRSETNVPAQSLTLLNDPFVRHEAKIWSQRITALNIDDGQRIVRMYEEAFAREPGAEELSRATAFLREGGNDGWRDLAHALFNMKEFIYLR
jgi:hypothetical protein